MKRYIGFLMMLIGAVAVYDATFGGNRPDDPKVIGLLVLLVVIPGYLLWRKKPPAKD